MFGYGQIIAWNSLKNNLSSTVKTLWLNVIDWFDNFYYNFWYGQFHTWSLSCNSKGNWNKNQPEIQMNVKINKLRREKSFNLNGWFVCFDCVSLRKVLIWKIETKLNIVLLVVTIYNDSTMQLLHCPLHFPLHMLLHFPLHL